MTNTTMVAFLKKVAEDERLRREFVELAARHGFRIDTDELTIADLKKVAGGLGRVKKVDLGSDDWR